jgi:hypothetical protein
MKWEQTMPTAASMGLGGQESTRATYSPEDNKLRMYPIAGRLDEGECERLRAAGFKWAPRQGLFVAPMWTPDREDLLIDLCGSIGDEDTSLVDRAVERSDRFEGYSHDRRADAEQAHDAASAIADNIPLGQPVLVGHHSERRARKDAQRIEDGMRKAIRLWDAAQYWLDRAKGAIAHAKHKGQPDVRARRIKSLEAEVRKVERSLKKKADCLMLWESCKNLAQARVIASYTDAGRLPCVKHPNLDQYLRPSDVLPFEDRYDRSYPTWTLEQVKVRAREVYGSRDSEDRWLAHYANRLAYERAMLAE